MRGAPTSALLCLALAALLNPPAEAWYKQAGGPSYYSVGRASGLLSGIRRSPYIRRSDDNGLADQSAESGSPDGGSSAAAAAAPFLTAELRQSPSGLRNMAVCVKEVAPELQRCQLLPGVPGVIQCKADVTVSLDPADCTGP